MPKTIATRLAKGLVRGDDGRVRCSWGSSSPDYQLYHDEEWGHPTLADHRLFEKICLEGFQSGLSWLTILRKRDNFRAAFRDFDFHQIARFNSRSVERLLGDPGIVRHRGKIESTLRNAKRAIEMEREFGSLAAYFWQWEPDPSSRPKTMSYSTLTRLTSSEESTALSQDLKKRGWSFVGPTTCYAFMQAMGLVNDHLEGCSAREEVEALRRKTQRPTPKRPARR